MRYFIRAIFAAVVAAVIASSAVSSDAAQRLRPPPSSRFDGLWSVSIVTTRGDCDRGYRYPLRIIGGHVVKADSDPNYQVAGAVARSGAIGVTISGGGKSASGHGRLTRDYGRGVWHTSNGECSGQWTAERRS
jgi:hypothetical protein